MVAGRSRASGNGCGASGHRRVCVKSILTGAHADLHSAQASPADAAAIVDAELDLASAAVHPWVDPVGRPSWCPGIDAYSPLGAVATTRPTNTSSTTPMSPARSRQRDRRLATFTRPILGTIERTLPSQPRRRRISKHVATTYPDAAVIVTEPFVHYLLAGLKIEPHLRQRNGNDPPRPIWRPCADMIAGREVAALLVEPADTYRGDRRTAGVRWSANHRVD